MLVEYVKGLGFVAGVMFIFVLTIWAIGFQRNRVKT
jgi:hypothetical protein